MSAMASQISGASIVYSTVCSGADQRKHQSSALLVFVSRIHRWPVNSPHKGTVTRKMFPFDGVIMKLHMQKVDSWRLEYCYCSVEISYRVCWLHYVNWASVDKIWINVMTLAAFSCVFVIVRLSRSVKGCRLDMQPSIACEIQADLDHVNVCWTEVCNSQCIRHIWLCLSGCFSGGLLRSAWSMLENRENHCNSVRCLCCVHLHSRTGGEWHSYIFLKSV